MSLGSSSGKSMVDPNITVPPIATGSVVRSSRFRGTSTVVTRSSPCGAGEYACRGSHPLSCVAHCTWISPCTSQTSPVAESIALTRTPNGPPAAVSGVSRSTAKSPLSDATLAPRNILLVRLMGLSRHIRMCHRCPGGLSWTSNRTSIRSPMSVSSSRDLAPSLHHPGLTTSGAGTACSSGPQTPAPHSWSVCQSRAMTPKKGMGLRLRKVRCTTNRPSPSAVLEVWKTM
jgi:hypothetical protein